MAQKNFKIYLYTITIIFGVYGILNFCLYNKSGTYKIQASIKENRYFQALPIIKKMPDVMTISDNANSQINQILYRADSLSNQVQINNSAPSVEKKTLNMFKIFLEEKYGNNKSDKIDKSIMKSQLNLTEKYMKLKKLLNGIKLGDSASMIQLSGLIERTESHWRKNLKDNKKVFEKSSSISDKVFKNHLKYINLEKISRISSKRILAENDPDTESLEDLTKNSDLGKQMTRLKVLTKILRFNQPTQNAQKANSNQVPQSTNTTKKAPIVTKKQKLTKSDATKKPQTTNTGTNPQTNTSKANSKVKDLKDQEKIAKKVAKKKMDFLSKIANFFKNGYNYVVNKLNQGSNALGDLAKQFKKKQDKTMKEQHGAGNRIFLKSKNLNGKTCQKYLSGVINFRYFQ